MNFSHLSFPRPESDSLWMYGANQPTGAMTQYSLSESCQLILRQGDITTMEVDAIVNAANQGMLGGGGVDGAIHRAAGPDLVNACRQFPLRDGKRCPTGEARITPGFRLPARHVIHAVGPRYRSEVTSAPLLEGAWRSSLDLANEHGLKTIAFPAISCGVYRYPLDAAARIAIATCREHAGELTDITIVLFDPAAFAAFEAAANAMLPDGGTP